MAYGEGQEFDKLEKAMVAANVAWWWMELPSGVVFFSPNKTNMIGRKADDFAHYKDFTKLVHKDDFDQMMQDMTDHLEGRAELYETTYRIKHSNGKYVRFYDRGKIVGKNKDRITLAGFVFDATDAELFKKSKVNN